MDKIRVCVVDDHTLFRKLMIEQISHLSRCDSAVLEADNGLELLKVLKSNKCDVILLDVNMPKMDGQEVLQVLQKKYPDIKIIILTMNNSPGKVITFLEMGVHGYLVKDCQPKDVEKAIYDVVDLDFYQNELSIQAFRMITKKQYENDEISKREKEIIKLICDEYNATEIANRLSLSVRTVENHRNNILKKLGIKNTVGIVRYAYESGLISIKGNL